jgi:VanZ family protein
MPAIFWACCIFIASSIPGGRLQWWILHRFDKILHAAIFAVFGLLVYRALHRGGKPSRFSYKRIFFMLVIVLGYGIFDELHQAYTPGRSVDVRDLLADLVGGILAGGIILISNMIDLRRSRLRDAAR